MPPSRRAEAVSTLIRLGWSPPPPNIEQSLRMLESMDEASRWNRTLGLTPSQLRLMTMLANGETTVSAAARLGVSKESTKSLAKEVRQKLGVKTVTHAVAVLVDEGVLEVRQLSGGR